MAIFTKAITSFEFDSWQCGIYIISHVHRAYDYLGPFGVLWVHMARHQLFEPLHAPYYFRNFGTVAGTFQIYVENLFVLPSVH